MALSTNLGMPRIGAGRELKRATEAYWRGEITAGEMERVGAAVRRSAWEMQRRAGIDLVPCNDFSYFDHVLDAITLVGAVPRRYGWRGGTVSLDTYFAMARGAQRPGLDVGALPVTKWFDTNYHHVVPELGSELRFSLASSKPFDELAEARAAGIEAKPVLLGPLSLILLARTRDAGFDALARCLDPLLDIYREVVARLAAAGARWIQLDEPLLVRDCARAELAALEKAYSALAEQCGGARLILQTYFGHVGAAYPRLRDLPVDALGLDFVRGPENLDHLKHHGLPAGRWLVAGIVDGRNVWAADLAAALRRLEELATLLGGADRLLVAPSCSLLHVPLDVEREIALDPELRSWLSFAVQKLDEVATLKRGLEGGRAAIAAELEANAGVHAARRDWSRVRDPGVRARLSALDPQAERRASPGELRRAAQRTRLALPELLPTTTVGSFPQTAELRRARQRYLAGDLAAAEYERGIEVEIRKVIELQEEIGLDLLVHGEPERADMVEHFAEQLGGCALTRHGWVQSYGTRCVRPPIIFGDVRRLRPMTVDRFRFAQSLTRKPVKGIVTGPVTLLQWSFVRDDEPRREVCRQLALAVRDEVLDLEAAGARAIQVDEPGLREGLPLRRAARAEYLEWAAAAFRLATSGVADATQIQTHMCYGALEDVVEAIAAMDADVLLFESARAASDHFGSLARARCACDLGPGVYDVHSPRVPQADEIVACLRAWLAVLEPSHLWVTPDCGLKTRDYDECVPALRQMVEAARRLRVELTR
jgi:5-methyltetrahydropteroyltriglutamate--homocysteine methyltransferase